MEQQQSVPAGVSGTIPTELKEELDIVIPTIRSLDFLEQWRCARSPARTPRAIGRRTPRPRPWISLNAIPLNQFLSPFRSPT